MDPTEPINWLRSDGWTEPECSQSHLRSRTGPLWSLTATYIAALTAYGHLNYSLQEERSVIRTVYKMIIFVILPLSPVFSLATGLGRAIWERRWHQRGNRTFLLASVAGLQIVRTDGGSEPLKFHHMWQGAFHTREEKRSVRVGRTVVLGLILCQCLGTLLRLASRSIILRTRFDRGAFTSYLPADGESLWLSIGTLAVLLNSWILLYLNVGWKYEYLPLQGSDRISSPNVGHFNSLAALLFSRRVLVTVIFSFHLAMFISAYVVSEKLPGRGRFVLAISWPFIILVSAAWLRKPEAEAISAGLPLFIGAYFASLASIYPRLLYYTVLGMDGPEPLWFWLPTPWPLVLSTPVVLLRILIVRVTSIQPSSRNSKVSHVCVVAISAFAMVVLPVYVVTWSLFDAFRSGAWLWPHFNDCPAALYQNPFWTPGF